jgi:hypothetical protein
MIEISDYRLGEQLGRSTISNWRIAETHQVDHFIRAGFPVRIESRHEVGQLLDTMHEGRFEPFMTELGGLTAAEADSLTDALVSSVKFQTAHLPRRNPCVPFSTMLSSLAIYKKIIGIRPDLETILEVGPGCGYLSFFLSEHEALKEYSQVESCESFYVLQSMINSYLFGHEFCDLAVTAAANRALHIHQGIDPPIVLADEEVPAYRCFHYPWWKLGMLHEAVGKYDIVTSNANLNEFTRNALYEYLTIFSRVMKDDGVFLIQCTGCPAHGSAEDLMEILHEFGFASLFCGMAVENVRPDMVLTDKYCSLGFHRKKFTINNLLLVKNGHPHYEANIGLKNYSHGFASDYPRLSHIYEGGTEEVPTGSRRAYSIDELLQAVRAKLLQDGATGAAAGYFSSRDTTPWNSARSDAARDQSPPDFGRGRSGTTPNDGKSAPPAVY